MCREYAAAVCDQCSKYSKGKITKKVSTMAMKNANRKYKMKSNNLMKLATKMDTKMDMKLGMTHVKKKSMARQLLSTFLPSFVPTQAQ